MAMAAELIGQPLDRRDGRAKVTGAARYAAEFPLPGLAHAVLVQSTVARGRIRSIDTREAERLPGVVAVLTHENTPALKPVPPADPRGGTSQSPGVELQLRDETVHYFGQNLAVVVAETLEQARAAAARVRITYSPEASETTFESRLDSARPPKFSVKGKEADKIKGDPEGALAAAEVKIDQTYTTPTENHNPMEMHATTAAWDGPRLTVHDATQYISGVRAALAAALGINQDDLRVLSPFMGGGFGSKGTTWPHVHLAAMAAKVVGRPVKLMLTRAQMFTTVGYRSPTVQRVALGADRDGTLKAVIHDTTAQSARYAEFTEACGLPTRMLYACPNVRTTHRIVELDTHVPTYMRAPGETPGVYALECAVDELAVALGIDPLELRLKNYAEADPDDGKPFSSKSLRECYQQGAERFGWSKRNPAPRSTRDALGRLVGSGMATVTYPMNRRPASALAKIFADGTAVVQSGSHDLGTGAYTVFTQVAAEALGLPVEKVRCELGDTNFPEAGVSGGSSTTASVGSAVHEACVAAREKVVALAVKDERSPLHGLAADKVKAAEGRLTAVDDPSRGEAYTEILRRHQMSSALGMADSKAGDEDQKYSMHAFGAVFAEVNVDPDLGMVRVQRIVGAYAAGRILNPKTARSQFLGGNVWGISQALLENTITDGRSGKIVNDNLADYLVPVNADCSEIDVIMIPEEDTKVNPIGVKGIGEIGIVGVAAAIANAVHHATGARIRDLPITTEKVLAAMNPGRNLATEGAAPAPPNAAPPPPPPPSPAPRAPQPRKERP
jgi:xanthine dehydrogenase YagR molybdenum-binding subunit